MLRNRALSTILASLVCAGALALGACGGDESPRRETTWQASDRLPIYRTHWWYEPNERACEEDSHCRSGERCRTMRLGTCPGCPRGEDARVCVPREGNATAGGGGAATKRGGTTGRR